MDLVLGMVPEWDELLVSTLELSASLMEAQWCALFLLEPGRQRLMLARMWDRGRGVVRGSCDIPPGELEWQVAGGNEAVAALCPKRVWIDERSEAGSHEVHSCAFVPVDVEGTRFGVVGLVRAPGAPPFTTPELNSLQLIARHVELWLRNSAILRQLRELAITDGLTGVYNHRYFQDRLELELERAARYKRPVSLAMLDLNGFKRYNDLYGHQQGDLVLRLAALAIQRVVRRVDVVARYGGDEFTVILPETGSLQGLVAANRILKAILALEIPTPTGCAEPISASIGVSSYPSLACGREDLIRQADEALYRAKYGRGRRVRLWEARWQRGARKVETGVLPA